MAACKPALCAGQDKSTLFQVRSQLSFWVSHLQVLMHVLGERQPFRPQRLWDRAVLHGQIGALSQNGDTNANKEGLLMPGEAPPWPLSVARCSLLLTFSGSCPSSARVAVFPCRDVQLVLGLIPSGLLTDETCLHGR